MSHPVRLGPTTDDAWLTEVCRSIEPEDVGAHLTLAARLTREAPAPATGRTLSRWELLASLGAADLTAARVVEAHLDAVAILDEAGAPQPPEGTTWGVFAAEAPDVRLDASAGAVTGTKPWCSLAGSLSNALVTAHSPQGRRLYAVDLRHPGVHPVAGGWHARGLVRVPSGPVRFDDVPATPVGEVGWYLTRPGFAYGGLGVAACWYGGAVGLARTLAAAAGRRAPDQIALWHLGSVDLSLCQARAVLADAARTVDAGEATGSAGQLLALRVRTVVAQAAEAVLASVGHALGPAPLALDADHARRVSDLTLYLRQHHAERDEVALGELLSQGPEPW